jgi:branched-chain amino acid transport system permease protein
VRRRHPVDAAHSVFAVRLCHARRRDSFLRSDAIGIDVKRVQWLAFVLIGGVWRTGRRPVCLLQGQHLAGIDGVALGGWAGDGLAGRRSDSGRPVDRAAVFTWLQDWLARDFNYWRALLGGSILVLVLLFPEGRYLAPVGSAIASWAFQRKEKLT